MCVCACQEDLGETSPAVQALAHLTSAPELAQRVAGHAPRIVSVLAAVAAQEGVPSEARALSARTLLELQAQHGAQLAPLLAALPAEQQAALQHWAGQQ